MEAALQAQVDRCDELIDELALDGHADELGGEHVLDALGQLGLALEPSPPGPWPVPLVDEQLGYARDIARLLPELDPVLVAGALDELDLVLVLARDFNPAALAWLVLVDERKGG